MNIALLIDGDNISHKYLPGIISDLQKRGTLSVKRIYGDWTTPNMTGWQDALRKFCIRPIQQFRYGDNATDGAIIMDAMEILMSTDRIDCFCIASSDSDFYNLCLRIRENGKKVIGIGNIQTKEVLKKACDEFVFLENLRIEEPKSTRESDREEFNPANILTQAYARCSNDEEWVSFANLGYVARVIDPTFDPRTYNHLNFRALVENLDIFEISKDDCLPPNYFCRLKEKPAAEKAKRLEGTIKLMKDWFGFIQAHDGDYYFTLSNVRQEQKHIWLERGMKVLFDVITPPDPTAAHTSEKNGKASNVEIILANHEHPATAK